MLKNTPNLTPFIEIINLKVTHHMSPLCNQTRIKSLLLEAAAERRAKKFTRVSQTAIDRVTRAGTAAMVAEVNRTVDTHPSVGTTIN